jgi:hypothetical protein
LKRQIDLTSNALVAWGEKKYQWHIAMADRHLLISRLTVK